jgi:2-dehydropantoate 2-reductase
MDKKHILVFGIGAVGGTIAAYLAKAGENVTTIDPWYAHIQTIQKRGLRVIEPTQEFTVQMRTVQLDQLRELKEPVDVAFLSMKSYDTEWATRLIVPYLARDGFIISAQNSLNEEIIASVAGQRRTMGLVVITSAGVFEPGVLTKYTTFGDRLEFEVGELDGRITRRLKGMAELLAKVGTTVTTANIWGALWSKLVHNSMVNALSGMTMLSSNPLYSNLTARKLMARIGREAILVGEAYGIRFEEIYDARAEDYKNLERGEGVIHEGILKQARLRSGAKDNPPSLQQDVMKGRRSEVDYLNGLVARKGRSKGVATPINEAITEAMHLVDGGLLKPGPANMEMFQKYIS